MRACASRASPRAIGRLGRSRATLRAAWGARWPGANRSSGCVRGGTAGAVGAAVNFLASPSAVPASSAFYAWTYERVLFPGWQRGVRRRSTFELLSRLEATQWLPASELEALQLESLRALLRHAGARVPYYRELFRKIGFDPRGVRSRADLAELPILTRDVVRERYGDLISTLHRGKNIRKGTSGTTGEPLKFEYCNESESWRQALRLRAYRWAGYRLGLPTVHYWAQGATVRRGIGAVKEWVDRALRREVYVDAIRQDERSMRAAVELIRRFRPHVIVGYTQATALLSRFVIDQKLRDWGNIPVICGAEAVWPSDRASIARAFGPDVFETYGSRETMLIGAECEAHRGLHVSEENLVVEITCDGEPVADGESGDVVITDLHNFGMPLIRYLNGDVAALSARPLGERACVCGRSLLRLERVDGRRADTLRDPSGAPIPGMVFIAMFAGPREIVRQFQVIQAPSGDVRLLVVPGNDWSEADFQGILGRLRPQLRGLMLESEVVDQIAVTSSGKRRPIVQLGDAPS